MAIPQAPVPPAPQPNNKFPDTGTSPHHTGTATRLAQAHIPDFRPWRKAGAFCLWASGVQEKCVWDKFSTFTEGSRTLPERRKTGVRSQSQNTLEREERRRGGGPSRCHLGQAPGHLAQSAEAQSGSGASQPASKREARNSPPRGCPASKDRGSPSQASLPLARPCNRAHVKSPSWGAVPTVRGSGHLLKGVPRVPSPRPALRATRAFAGAQGPSPSAHPPGPGPLRAPHRVPAPPWRRPGLPRPGPRRLPLRAPPPPPRTAGSPECWRWAGGGGGGARPGDGGQGTGRGPRAPRLFRPQRQQKQSPPPPLQPAGAGAGTRASARPPHGEEARGAGRGARGAGVPTGEGGVRGPGSKELGTAGRGQVWGARARARRGQCPEDVSGTRPPAPPSRTWGGPLSGFTASGGLSELPTAGWHSAPRAPRPGSCAMCEARLATWVGAKRPI